MQAGPGVVTRRPVITHAAVRTTPHTTSTAWRRHQQTLLGAKWSWWWRLWCTGDMVLGCGALWVWRRVKWLWVCGPYVVKGVCVCDDDGCLQCWWEWWSVHVYGVMEMVLISDAVDECDCVDLLCEDTRITRWSQPLAPGIDDLQITLSQLKMFGDRAALLGIERTRTCCFHEEKNITKDGEQTKHK